MFPEEADLYVKISLDLRARGFIDLMDASMIGLEKLQGSAGLRKALLRMQSTLLFTN